MPPYLIYVSKDHCPYCVKFAPEWERLYNDQELINRINFRYFVSITGSDLPAQLGRITGVPKIFLVSSYDYERAFDPRSGQILSPIEMKRDDYKGSMTAENIKAWILRSRVK